MSARIAVVGGGFSGAAFALHLLRGFPDLAADIAIIEPRERLGGGLAYGTTDKQHRINVAAARMAVFAEDPEHFDRWFRATGGLHDDPAAEVAGVGLFPRRAAFGRYVDSLLRDSAAAAPSARLRHVRDRVRAIEAADGGWRLALAGGGSVAADLVVLAVGHPPAAAPSPLAALAGDPGLLSDPWSALAVPPDARVLIVGTGLTMTDVVASLRANGHRGGIVAVSRRGLLPRPRTRQPVRPRGAFATPASGSALALLRRVRGEVAAGEAEGRPWEDVIDALRAQGREVWSALPPPERRRLLRHLQPFWDVHRYQCAPQIDALLRTELASGGLRVFAASLRGAVRRLAGIRVLLHPRGAPADDVTSLDCDVVITCTGPSHRTAIAGNPALRRLSRAGLIVPDPYGLGIAVDDQGRALTVAGCALDTLRVVGPPARGTWGELMGLPQVSQQPRDVAAHVAALIGQPEFLPAEEANA